MADVLRATRPVAIAPPGFRRPHDRLSFLIRRSTARDSGSPLRLSLPDLSTIDRPNAGARSLPQLLLIHGGPNALAQPQNPPHWSLPSNCSPFFPFDPRSKSCSTSCVHLCQRRTSTTSCWTCLPAGPYVVHHRCISPGITNRRSSLFMTSPRFRALPGDHRKVYSNRSEADFVMPSLISKFGAMASKSVEETGRCSSVRSVQFQARICSIRMLYRIRELGSYRRIEVQEGSGIHQNSFCRQSHRLHT